MKTSNLPTKIATILFAAALASQASALERAGYRYGSFTAKYYFEDDGRDPFDGGTDGTDPTITPILRKTTTVDYPSVAGTLYRDVHYNAYNFYALWEGEIEVFDEQVTLNANISGGRSHRSVQIGSALPRTTNHTSEVTLTKGKHPVRIEFHNHWHTADFVASFTDYPRRTLADEEALGVVKSWITEQTKVIYIGAYESSDDYATASVNLPEYSGKYILVLGSHRSINWVINAPNPAQITGVVMGRFGSTINLPPEIPVIEITNMAYAVHDRTDDRASALKNTLDLTGRSEPDFLHLQYTTTSVDVPAFEPLCHESCCWQY